MIGTDSFSFDYKVQWPLSIILSRKSLTKYQLLFRHLFLFKLVERQLCNAWFLNQFARDFRLSKALSSCFRLRQRMLHLLQNIQYYMSFEVIEPNWHIMEQSLKKVCNPSF